MTAPRTPTPRPSSTEAPVGDSGNPLTSIVDDKSETPALVTAKDDKNTPARALTGAWRQEG